MTSLTLTGTLTHARACVAGRSGQDAVLIFEIASGGSGWPLEARWFVGDLPESHVLAGDIVGRLTPHARITVEAAGLMPRTDFGVATLVLQHVRSIECGDLRLTQ